MAIIAINMGNRLIDKLAPQEHREISKQQAEIYKRLLPREIKIIENNEPSNIPEEVPTLDTTHVIEEVTPVEGFVPTNELPIIDDIQDDEIF